MVLLHGMRDHAGSMARIAEAFPDYRVVAADLRGHGHSDHPGMYGLMHFIADLRALIAHFGLARPILVGHSLGGHVCWLFSAAYPDITHRLVLLDGLGPPNLPESFPMSMIQERWRFQVDELLAPGPSRRSMADAAEAAQRLRRNNPQLDPAWADSLAADGVEPDGQGGVRWRWDPAAEMVFSTFPGQSAELFYPLIECPVQIITGEQGIEYWARQRPDLLERRAAFDAANEARRKIFRDARHTVIPQAGHMLNYDRPDALNQVIRAFLEQVQTR